MGHLNYSVASGKEEASSTLEKILCFSMDYSILCNVQHCSGCKRVKQYAWEDDEHWFQCCFQLRLIKNCIQEKQSRAMGSCFRRKNRCWRWQIYASGDWYNKLEEVMQEKAKHFKQCSVFSLCFLRMGCIILWNIWYAAVLNAPTPILGGKLQLTQVTCVLACVRYQNKECISCSISAFYSYGQVENSRQSSFKDIFASSIINFSTFKTSPKAWNQFLLSTSAMLKATQWSGAGSWGWSN